MWTYDDTSFVKIICVLLVGTAVACSAKPSGTSGSPTSPNSPGSPTATPATVTIVSGGNQAGAPSSVLAAPIVVEVRDASGAPVGGVNVQFVTGGEGQFVGGGPVDGNGGSVTNMLARVTGSDGRASAQYRLGADPGIYAAAARVVVASTTLLAGTRVTASAPNPALVATVAVGAGPQGVAVDSLSNTVYVGNNGTFFGCTDLETGTSVESSTISVIDGATNGVTTVSAGGNSPIYAVPNPGTGKIYVAAAGLTVLAEGTLSQVARINEAATHQPAINAARNEIWSNTKHGPGATPALSLVDGAADKLLAYVDLPDQVHGVAVSEARNEVYASRVDAGGVFVVNGASRTLAATIVLPHSLAIAYNPTTDRIYVSSGNFGQVHVIDGATRALVASIPINAHAIEMAVDRARNRIYAASESNPYSLLVIDGATNTLLGRVPVGDCPFGVAYNPRTGRIYVSNGHDNNVTVLDASKIPF